MAATVSSSSYSGEMLSSICLEYELDWWLILTYCTFTYFIMSASVFVMYTAHLHENTGTLSMWENSPAVITVVK